MAKQYLVESCTNSRSLYVNLTNVPEYAPVVENANRIWANCHVEKLSESTKKSLKSLKEGVNDKALMTKVISELKEQGLNPPQLWKFPISRINTIDSPNLNGRVYGKDLWENVLTKQVEAWKTGTGLANHPADDEDGDFMKQSIVWLDGLIEGDIVYGIGALVGEGGKLAQQIIEAGGKVGFSTAGFGEVLAEGVVDPETYEIDRFADLVLNPSQGVFGNAADAYKAKTNESVKENDMKKAVKESAKAKGLLEDEEVEDQNEGAEDQNTEDEEGSEEEGETEAVNESEESSNEEDTDDSEGEEASEEDEEETLSEKLVLDHYMTAIESVAKKPGREWQSKVEQLESLAKKIGREKLSKKNIRAVNEKINGIINGIVKETEKVIQEGYDAKDICKEMGITSIAKLAGVKDILEDYAAVQECLASAQKEANKYKDLYESKAENFENFAKGSVKDVETIETLNARIATLESKLAKARDANHKLFKENRDLDAANRTLQEKVAKLGRTVVAEQKAKAKAVNAGVANARKARAFDLAEKRERAYANSITNFENRMEEAENALFGGQKTRGAESRAERKALLDEAVVNRTVREKRPNDIESLSDMFRS